MRYGIILLILCFTLSLKAQNALNFDGTDDYIVTNFSGPSGTSERTVEAWVKTSFLGTQKVITDWGDMSLGNRFTMNMINGLLRIEVGGAGLFGTTNIADGQWHHVAAVYSPFTAVPYLLYVDGVLDGSGTLSQSMNTSTVNPLIIGVRNDNVNYWDGEIDEVRVWSVAKSASEIAAGINQKICGPSQDLVFYYDFDQGLASGNNTGLDTLVDLAGNSNTGDLINFALNGSTSNWVNGVNISGGVFLDSISVQSCGPYTSPSGDTVWANSGNYIDTVISSSGCDSILFIDLSIASPSTATVFDTVCDFYISPSGQQFDQTGVYFDTIPNSQNCDSIITINLLKVNIDTSVTYANNVITSNESTGTYQWYRCQSGNYNIIAGETSQSFAISQSALYAVVINKFGCQDTSECELFTYLPPQNLGISEESEFKVFPVPFNDKLTIDFNQNKIQDELEIEISDISGKVLFHERVSASHEFHFKDSLLDGLYIFKIQSKKFTKTFKIWKRS